MSKEHAAFFYGTLMHPKILKAVIRNEGTHLKACPAILLDYTRHEVKGCDYPGIIAFERGREIINRTLTQEERSVRGTLVTGLTNEDMTYLDEFEGDEYIKERVKVHPLGSFTILSIETEALVPRHPPPIGPLPSPDALQTVEAETYVYRDESNLEGNLWSFEDFVANNAWKWYGGSR